MTNKNTLYVIGNGFDLYHGLKTGYSDFQKYLAKENPPLLYSLDSYFAADLWGDFEKNLAELDIEQIFADNDDLLPYEDSDRDGDKYVFIDKMEQVRENLTVGLRNELRNWILSLDYPSNIDNIHLGLDASATFLTFNYSVTLERLYDINSAQITHIHNKAQWLDIESVRPKERYLFEMSENFSAKYGSFWPEEAQIRSRILGDESDIIIGHAVKDFQLKMPHFKRKGINSLYSYEEGYDAMKSYDNYKDTQQIICNNRQFFDSLDTVEKIVIIGHSLSDVDLPYFVELKKMASNCKQYKITYYGKDNLKKIRSQFEKFTYSADHIKFVDIEDDIENLRQLLN